MIGYRFEKDGKTYEGLTAPVLNAAGDLVIMAVEMEAGEVITIATDDIKQLVRPPMPKLDS